MLYLYIFFYFTLSTTPLSKSGVKGVKHLIMSRGKAYSKMHWEIENGLEPMHWEIENGLEPAFYILLFLE